MVLVVIPVFTIGSSGASSVTADRGVALSVAEDQQAVVGFEHTHRQTGYQTGTVDVTVTNQFSAHIELTTVEITVDNTTVDVAENNSLNPRERRTHTFTAVRCTDEITVHVSSDDVTTRFDRSLRC